MDLEAYINIEGLEQIAKENGIDIPRLRGYRLMKEEEPISQKKIDEMKSYTVAATVEDLCEADPFWNPNSSSHELSPRTNQLKDFYLIKDADGYYADVRWDRIHGRKRKILKFKVKKQQKKIQQQYDMWNKYAGKENVLYIHSRMGGKNWEYYHDKANLLSQPWFLGRVDDAFDSTYCDFYAKIRHFPGAVQKG